MAPVDGPIQCGPNQKCKDYSCCNSLGKCGLQQIHCRATTLPLASPTAIPKLCVVWTAGTARQSAV
jgi:hypothetical protein